MNLELNGENNRSKRDAFIKVTRETRATAIIIDPRYGNNPGNVLTAWFE